MQAENLAQHKHLGAFPCGESIDVVNVHAPSGYRTLKDPQRKTLLTTMLQSSSQTRPDASIGDAHFLIGGDMNTTRQRTEHTEGNEVKSQKVQVIMQSP